MLAGLPAVFLEGIASQAPEHGHSINGRSLLIAMNPSASANLEVREPAVPSYESAVHWRHSTEAKVILFAPSDAEREGIGAGLGPVARIDSQVIVDQTRAWLQALNETGAAKSYMFAMLKGLRNSQIFIDLEMWVDFILAITKQGFAYPPHLRVQHAAPALRIPRDGFTKLPAFKPEGNQRVNPKDFHLAFQTARAEVGVYAGLMTPKQEPVEARSVLEAVATYDHQDDIGNLDALKTVKDLLKDEPNIRPGEWRDSQRNFCEVVSWERIGAYLFTGGRKNTRQSLGESTLKFIEGNYRDEVTQDDRRLLESLNDSMPREPKVEEIEFFERWQERLNHPKVVNLYKNWQKRLFAKDVLGHDLLSAFSEGFEALIVASGESLAEMNEPRILVRTSAHNKAMFWEKLDIGVQSLFRFELMSVQGLFGDSVLWDLDACFRHNAVDSSSSNDARKVDLELYLVEAADVVNFSKLPTPPKNAPRVRATWQPGLKPKDEPIGLALPDDFAALANAAKHNVGLFRRHVFAPRPGVDGAMISSTTLSDRNSFSDVAQAQGGRTFDTTIRREDDLLAELRCKILELAKVRSIEAAAASQLTSAVDTFEEQYRTAILAIGKCPKAGFANASIQAQAEAFGNLCLTCRQNAKTERARIEIRSLVAKIGIVSSSRSDQMAILAAWHPFRLAERQAKILDLANFIKSVLHSQAAAKSDLTIAFDERRALTNKWVFPEAVVVDETTMVSVEDVAGYSLMVPAEGVSQSQEALEGSTPSAAAKFIECVDQYLEVHPHEATNLSSAIYDSESITLPNEITRQMVQRIHRDQDLRCQLVVTHHEQGRMRSIYRNQNMCLDFEDSGDVAKGFISRLRVDVRPNRFMPGHEDAIREVDLVFLHDAVSHVATPVWDFEPACAEDFNSAFSVALASKPRRRLSEVDAPGVGVYLTLPRPPRAVAQYQDLLYEMSKSAVLPEQHHGVLVRQVRFDAPELQQIIKRAHDLGEWVVSYDKISSRKLLEKSGIKIIRDFSVPGAGSRVIISAGKVDSRLKFNIKQVLIESCGIKEEVAVRYSDVVLEDTLKISGQKVLSGAKFANSSREMVGLCVLRAHLEAALPENLDDTAHPVWISLDDYRGWFTSGKGKIADTVAITIVDLGHRFKLMVQVGEAKFIGMNSELVETREARHQVRDTLERLKRILVDNVDVVSRTAWCSRLADLLVNRDGLSDILPDPIRRAAFVDCLSAGAVDFRISGEAVICLHDDHSTEPKLETDPEQPYIRWHVLPSPIVQKTLQIVAEGGVPNREGLRYVRWYRGTDDAKAACLDFSAWSQGKSEEQPTRRLKVPKSNPTTNVTDHLDGISVLSEEIETEITNAVKGDSSISPVPEPTSDSNVSKERSRFVAEPIYFILNKMAKCEEGKIDDVNSIAWAKEVSEATQRALSHFGMQAHFSEPRFRLTPNGTLITFRGHETLTVDKIERRTGEMLTTHGIEVVDVRPGRGKISLFVKRDKRALVPLGSTWLSAPWPNREPGELTNFILGAREDDDHLLFLNLAGEFANYEEHGPHTLIAGGTGSGKGILTQSLLLQLISFNDPDRAELILVDPKKGVDFAWLNGVPHLRTPIVTEMEEASSVFKSLVRQMDDRYELLAKVGAQNIAQYNSKVDSMNRMRRIFLVHDEMGAWMAQEKEYQEVVLSAVANLGMKARAAGIHLVLITQRADADAVPPRLRDNMGNRLCLKVQNSTGSRMVLGVAGAEKLLGKGHLACVMAYQSPPAGQVFHVVQVPFAEPEDMQLLADAAMSYWRAHKEGHPSLLGQSSEGNSQQVQTTVLSR